MAMNASLMTAYSWLSCLAIAAPLRSAERRSAKGFSVAKTMPAVGAVGEAVDRQARKRNRTLDARRLQGDLAHPADDILGTIERGAVGKLREADEILLVLPGHEAPWHRLEQAGSDADQNEVDQEGDSLARQKAADAAAVGDPIPS